MKIKYTVEGIDCPNCAAKLAAQIEKREGISSCKINFLSERLTVESDLSEDEILAIVSEECRAFSKDIKIGK